jgi:hypothetical protein
VPGTNRSSVSVVEWKSPNVASSIGYLEATLGVIFAALAVIAAAVAIVYARKTVWFARQTVSEAQKARDDAHRDHENEARTQREAHRDELDAERVLEQLRQLDRIAEIVLAITTAALHEIEHPAPTLDDMLSTSRLPSLLGRLHVALAVFRSLGGSSLSATQTLAEQGAGKPGIVFSFARIAVPEIQATAGFDVRLERVMTRIEARVAAAQPRDGGTPTLGGASPAYGAGMD